MKIWADDLLHEYGIGKKDLERRRDRVDRTNSSGRNDLTHINSMIESMAFSMEFMETGKEPGTYKGIDKKRIYQRQSFASMDFIPDIAEQLELEPKELFINAEQKKILEEIFAVLSLRERQCYILHFAKGWSWASIAEEIGVSKGTVQGYIRRAQKKIKEKVS